MSRLRTVLAVWLVTGAWGLSSILAGEVPVEEAMPPLYRKISLDGRPLKDPMPQNLERNDNEPEETYVDALTLRLQHRTSDIYIPILSEGFALSVFRNVEGAAWKSDGGLHPAQRPDLPFGNCWSSGVAANVHLITRAGQAGIRASVTDDEGAIHEFCAVAADNRRFFPLPTTRSCQDWSSIRLESRDGGRFVLRKKYGNILAFRKEASTHLKLGSGDAEETHEFFRLESVADRFGSKIEYRYAEANLGVIPNEIVYRSRRVRLEMNRTGQVERMIDPKGGDRTFEYRASRQPGGVPLMVATRAQIVGDNRGITRYEYEEVAEGDAHAPAAYHCNVTRIVDARGKAYAMEYAFDTSRPGAGAVRRMKVSTLPDEIGKARFTDESQNASDNGEMRRTLIRDAAGNVRRYEFAGHHVENCVVDSDAHVLARLAVYRTLTISTFSGDLRKSSEGDGTSQPTDDANLLSKESYEFDAGAGLALVKAVDLSGNVVRFDYAEPFAKPLFFASRRSDVTTFTDGLGATCQFSYEPSLRRRIRSTDAAGRIKLEVIDSPLGRVISERLYASLEHLERDKPFTQTDYEFRDPSNPGFATRKTVRKTGASPEKVKWEQDLVTDFTCEELGKVERETVDPGGLNLGSVREYDENGNLLSRTYANGYRIDFKYDAVNRLTRVFRPGTDGGRTGRRLAYDLRGNKIEEVQPTGESTRMEYDGMNRLVREVSSSSPENVLAYEYNVFGGQTKSMDKAGKSFWSEFDGLGRVVKRTYESGRVEVSSFGKNCGSSLFDTSVYRPTSFDIQGGRITVTLFDANYRRTSALVSSKPGDVPKEWRYLYDAVGNCVREFDSAGQQTNHEYDALDRLVKTRYPGGGVERTLYTSTGLKYATVNTDGKRAEETFDAAGEPIEKGK